MVAFITFYGLVVFVCAGLVIGKSSRNSYTVKDINDIYSQYTDLLRDKPVEIKRMIDLLVQVTIQQQARVDILERSYTELRSELSEFKVDLLYVKTFVYEQMTLHHKGSAQSITRSGKPILGKWDVGVTMGDNSRTLRQDLKQLNNSVISMGLRVDELHSHIEDIETLVYEAKRSKDSHFIQILNNILPELQKDIEQRYNQTFAMQIASILNTSRQLPNKESSACQLTMTVSDELHQADKSSNTTGQQTQTENKATEATEVKYEDKAEFSSLNRTGDNSAETSSALNKLSEVYSRKCTKKFMQEVKPASPVLTVYGSRSKFIGSWMIDGAIPTNSIYKFDGFRKLRILSEYRNLEEFKQRKLFKLHRLPFRCGGTGHAVYNNSIYCAGFNRSKILKYNLKTNDTAKVHLPGAGNNGLSTYSIGAFNSVDILTDRIGLWVVFSMDKADGKMTIAKLNPVSLEIQFTDTTNSFMAEYLNGFMICGELYVLKNINTVTKIERIWSVNRNLSSYEDENNTILLEPYQQAVVMADYNPQLEKLMTWNVVEIGLAVLKMYDIIMQ